jgi:hypothetical protein
LRYLVRESGVRCVFVERLMADGQKEHRAKAKALLAWGATNCPVCGSNCA